MSTDLTSKNITIDGPLTSQAITCTLHTSGIQRKLNQAFMSTNPNVRKSAFESQDRVQKAIMAFEESLRQARNHIDNASVDRKRRPRPQAEAAAKQDSGSKKQSKTAGPSKKSAPKTKVTKED